MNIKKLVLGFLAINSLSYGNMSVNSEMSHLVGGAVMAGAISYTVDKYYPQERENQENIAFWTSSLLMIAESTVEYKLHGEGRNQSIDAISHIIGSAIGAYATSQYLLVPSIHKDKEEITVGLQLKSSF
jgi:hypothetical protein